MPFALLGLMLIGAVAFFLLPSNAEAETASTPYVPPQNDFNWSVFSTPDETPNQLPADYTNPMQASSEANNVIAFLAMIRFVEAQNRYDIIAGGDTFSDYSEHPFILNPKRARPLGTTASGGYQMVRDTWLAAKSDLGLTDFSPASQDAAAIWILQVKRPGAYDLVARGDVQGAMRRLKNEWEAFDKMLAGKYPISIASAQSVFTQYGGSVA